MSDINWNNRLEIIRAIKNDNIGSELIHAPEHIKKDKDLIKLAFANDYSYFDYAHDELKNDKDFIKELIITFEEESNGILYYIDDKLINDKEFIKELILLNNKILDYYKDNYIITKFLNDKEFVLFAIKINEDVFKFLSDELKNDKKFMLEVLKANFGALPLIATYHCKEELSEWWYNNCD
jgi:hypothetical protein